MSEPISELVADIQRRTVEIASQVQAMRAFLATFEETRAQFLQEFTLAKPSHTRKSADSLEAPPYV